MLRKLSRRLFFSLSYFRRPPWDTGVSPPELVRFLEQHPPGRALDLGCGTGTNVIALAHHGWQAMGVDFAPRAIALARRKAHRAGVQRRATFEVQDVTRLRGLSGPFDLVLDMGCFHNLGPDGRRDYLETLARLLAPGGAFLLYGFLAQGEEEHGISLADEQALAARFRQVSREEGRDRHRPSAWFEFVKPLTG